MEPRVRCPAEGIHSTKPPRGEDCAPVAADRRGVATRALRLIVEWTLETTGVLRLEVYTDVANEASGRVAERVGFGREGIRRAWDLDRDGTPLDATFYVRLRDPSEPAGAPPPAR